MTNIDEKPNFFDEEYLKLLPENKSYLTLNEVLQMKILDENNESRINFNHIRKQKHINIVFYFI